MIYVFVIIKSEQCISIKPNTAKIPYTCIILLIGRDLSFNQIDSIITVLE